MKEYKFKINGNEYTVEVAGIEDHIATVSVNGAQYEVEIEGLAVSPKPLTKTPKVVSTSTVPVTDDVPVRTARPEASATAGDVKSPLPGVILELSGKVGDSVKVGQRLLILEAMKMENNIDSDKEGVVKEIRVSKGDTVLEGDVLLTIG